MLLNVNRPGADHQARYGPQPGDLLVTGAGNIAAGLVGRPAGCIPTSAFPRFNRQMTGGKRLTSLVTAVLLGLTVFGGRFVPDLRSQGGAGRRHLLHRAIPVV